MPEYTPTPDELEEMFTSFDLIHLLQAVPHNKVIERAIESLQERIEATERLQ